MTETTENEVQAPKQTRKPRAKRRFKTRGQAANAMLDANVPYPDDIEDDELIELANALPIEKYYKILIQDKNDGTEIAMVRVNGKPFYIRRGEEVIVPARVLNNMKNAVQHNVTHVRSKESDHPKLVQRKEMFEMYSVIEEVPNPKWG